jgi:glycosyltransferase involved in cell wall biosynthesis
VAAKSVVVISYRNPAMLELCARSLFDGQDAENEIIVVLDGYGEESHEVIKKFPGLNVLEFPQNRGQTVAHNIGVSQASNEKVLILNDDNVAPPHWDTALEEVNGPDLVIAPNQIEPAPSIFKSFVHRDFGKTAEEFQYEEFQKFATEVSGEALRTRQLIGRDGQTWPLYISKKWYMVLGGIDPLFPHPSVADWDFFLRCELAGLSCLRFFGSHFYHFAGAATRKVDAAWNDKEQDSFEYFAYKWGYYPTMKAHNHSKINEQLDVVRGVRFL